MRALALLVAVALLPFCVQSVSSEQAKAVAEAYLLKGEVAVVGQYNPIEYGSERYWLVYFAPQDNAEGKNLVVAVKEEGDGATLETGRPALEEIFGIDFGIDQLSFIRERKISYDDLGNTVAQVKAKIAQNARPGLERIEAQQSSYPDIDFEEVSSLLRDLEDAADRATEVISDGRSYEESFAQSFYSTDLQTAIDGYPKAFDELSSLVRAAGLYHRAIDAKQLEIQKAELSSEVGGTLIKSLDSIRDAGIDKSYETFLDPRKRDLETRLSHKASAVNNSISGFYYRKAKVEAQRAYDELAARTYSPEALLSTYKADMASCGISYSELSTKWLGLKQLMTSTGASTEQYSRVPINATELGTLSDSIYQRLENCINAPASATPSPVQKPLDLTPVFYVLLVAVVAFVVYRYVKQRQEQQAQDDE